MLSTIGDANTAEATSREYEYKMRYGRPTLQSVKYTSTKAIGLHKCITDYIE